MTKININKKWDLFVLEINESSPLKDHDVMEIGVDNQRENLFVYELMIITYGLESVKKAAKQYINK